MNYSRRGFLKAMGVMSGTALLAPGLLTARSAFAADEAPGVSEDITTWRISGSHFGAIRAKVVGDRVVDVRPFEYDKHPTEMIQGIVVRPFEPAVHFRALLLKPPGSANSRLVSAFVAEHYAVRNAFAVSEESAR